MAIDNPISIKNGIPIKYKCNICNITESDNWYRDDIKRIGWKCGICYNSVKRALSTPYHILRNGPVKRTNLNGGRIAMTTIMEEIITYLSSSENNLEEFHSVASISAAIKRNYTTTHRAMKMIGTMNVFFKEYNLTIKKLKTTSRSYRDKMEVITISKREVRIE